MKKVTFMKGDLAGEDALVNELARPEKDGLSLLQKYNDSSELLHVEFFQKKDGKIVADGRGNPLPVESSMSYLKLKRALRAQKTLSFVTMDTLKSERVIVVKAPSVEETVFVAEFENSRGTGIKQYFLDEGMVDERKGTIIDYKSKWTVCMRAVVVSKKYQANLLFPCTSRSEAEELAKEISETMLGGKILEISGMEVPEVFESKASRTSNVSMKIIVNNYEIYKDKFSDVKEVLTKLKSWKDFAIWRDLAKGNIYYSQEVNELLMFSTMYVKQGRAVFNLILSGLPSTAKTTCLSEYARIFGDGGRIVQAQGATTKGLVPSFGSDTPKEGYLASPGFLKVVDEIFRHVSSQGDSKGMNNLTSAIGDYLSKLLPILTRREQIYPSGRDTEFSVCMKAALLATDNLRQDVRVALANQVENDPAVLRRFTIVYLDEQEYENIKSTTFIPPDDKLHSEVKKYWQLKYGYNVEQLRRFSEWSREMLKGISADSSMCLKIADRMVSDELKKDIARGIDDDKVKKFARKIDFVDHIRALSECCALMRCVYKYKSGAMPKEVKVEKQDYDEAERIFARILHDCLFLFKSNMAELINVEGLQLMGGVKRF